MRRVARVGGCADVRQSAAGRPCEGGSAPSSIRGKGRRISVASDGCQRWSRQALLRKDGPDLLPFHLWYFPGPPPPCG